MGIKIGNLSEVDSGFKALPNGTYKGNIFSMTPKTGQDSGKPYIAISIKLEADPARQVTKGRQVFTNLSLQEQSLWRVKQFLLRMGKSEGELKGEVELEPNEYLGRPVIVELGPPDQGYNANKVLEVWGPNGPEAKANAASPAGAAGW